MKREIEEAIVKASHIYPAYQQKPYLDGGLFGYNLAVDKGLEFIRDVEFGGWIEDEVENFISRYIEWMKGE